MSVIVDDSVPFVGRAEHCATFGNAILNVRGSLARVHLHFSGPPQFGKTRLCEELKRRAKIGKNAICLDLDLSDPNGYDPYLYLLKLRELARRAIPNINTDAFDYIAMFFALEHRRGSNYIERFLGDSAFDPKLLLTESLTDVIKKGAESAFSDLWKTLVPATVAGTMTLAKALEYVPSVLYAGGSAAGVALGTAALTIVYKVATQKFRQKRLKRSHKLVAEMMARKSAPRASELLAMLPNLLGVAMEEAVLRKPEAVCVFFHPSEVLATSNDAARRTGRALFEGVAAVKRSIVITTSETLFDRWFSGIECGALLKQHRRPPAMVLEKFRVDEVRMVLIAEKVNVECALAALVDDDGTIFPRRFRDWWVSQMEAQNTGRQGGRQ